MLAGDFVDKIYSDEFLFSFEYFLLGFSIGILTNILILMVAKYNDQIVHPGHEEHASMMIVLSLVLLLVTIFWPFLLPVCSVLFFIYGVVFLLVKLFS